MHARSFAVRAAIRLEVVLESVFYQRRKAGIGLDDHVAAMAAVAAVGTALRDVRLSTERHATCAAVAASNMNAYFIDEHVIEPRIS